MIIITSHIVARLPPIQQWCQTEKNPQKPLMGVMFSLENQAS
jgi:hypothetical protein